MRWLPALLVMTICLSGCARTYRSPMAFSAAIARISPPLHHELALVDLQATGNAAVSAVGEPLVSVRELSPQERESLLVISDAMPPWPFQLRSVDRDDGAVAFEILSDTSGISLRRGRLILMSHGDPGLVRLDCDVDEVRAWAIRRLGLTRP